MSEELGEFGSARTRILRAYLIAASVLGPGYGAFFAYFDGWWSFGIAMFFLASTLLAWPLHLIGCHKIAGVILVCAIWIAPAWVTLFNGGVGSPVLVWLAPAPFMTGALLGPRSAVVAGIVGVIFIALLAIVGTEAFPQEMRETQTLRILSGTAGGTAVALLSFYGWATTKNYQEAQGALAREHRDVVAFSSQLDQRNRAMRLVLDNVRQGILVMDTDGVLASETSRAFSNWFREPRPGETLVHLLSEVSPVAAEYLEMGLEDLRVGSLPEEVVLDQLPKSLNVGERHFRLEYHPVRDGLELVSVLVVISDETKAVLAEASERRRRELLSVLKSGTEDRAGLLAFLEEADQIVRQACGDHEETPVLMRALHTLKGNSSLFGLRSFAQFVHRVEDELKSAGRLSPLHQEQLEESWKGERRRIEELGFKADDTMRLPRSDMHRLYQEVERGASYEVLRELVTQLFYEPVLPRLQNLARQAERLAAQLEKSVQVNSRDHGVRLPPKQFDDLWSALVHVVRNAVDHGLEEPAERERLGKGRSSLTLETKISDHCLTIELTDDGRGIDWARVAEKAREGGLPSKTHDELVSALLSDGLSTRERTTELSGRGVGMAAVAECVKVHRGKLQIESDPGKGTRISLSLPIVEPAELSTRRAQFSEPPMPSSSSG